MMFVLESDFDFDILLMTTLSNKIIEDHSRKIFEKVFMN